MRTLKSWPETISLPISSVIAVVHHVRIELVVEQDAHIDNVALAAAYCAAHANLPVVFEFNGHWMTAYPHQPVEEVVALYWSKVARPTMSEDAPGSTQATEPRPGTTDALLAARDP